MSDPSSEKLRAPLVFLRPQVKVCEPVMLHMETWVAERVFGPMQPSDPFNGRIWITVGAGDTGNVAEITIYGEPSLKRRLKNLILHFEAKHKNEEDYRRARTMKHLEEFLKNHSPNGGKRHLLTDRQTCFQPVEPKRNRFLKSPHLVSFLPLFLSLFISPSSKLKNCSNIEMTFFGLLFSSLTIKQT